MMGRLARPAMSGLVGVGIYELNSIDGLNPTVHGILLVVLILSLAGITKYAEHQPPPGVISAGRPPAEE